MTGIVPPAMHGEPPAAASPWSPLHLRLHRTLLLQPELLPPGERLLLAVSGGQDSMAMTGLLLDLRRLHHWQLHLWHGDHGWRPEASSQARELATWARQQQLPLELATPDRALASEAEAREWRYHCLQHQALGLGCRRVATGHTASDRAETMLLHLARGTHLRGLASLRRLRPSSGTVQIARPLLGLMRQETERFCADRGLPVWPDSSNTDPRFSRNRIRHQVLPVLEELHPGASRRMNALAERLEHGQALQSELLALSIAALSEPDSPRTLRRAALAGLSAATQRVVLHHWIERETGSGPLSSQLERLRQRLPPERGAGSLDLAEGWRLVWGRATLTLERSVSRTDPASASTLHATPH
ncbi:tRNA lysidine(34) synthetase TilS [Synechococcus sp. MW101C3]|uniref:tRNA lysidine(34) synthetase TilS n=1 Tax=Synechococcus sp. MW101C3 TaxID=210768 RepID=UPI001E4E4D0D|nr:tRNA lysidine(34) synthetase TilS [Synechococcus sp. MW101C3]